MYRSIVPMTHEQYLDEPGHVIQWTVRIHRLVLAQEEKDAERARKEAEQKG